ncbi:MAG: DUF1538 domain-containing protein [Actinobacteria bacterium]|nr:DUF1538 domain-containing protein [Actinomycetota bacterium]
MKKINNARRPGVSFALTAKRIKRYFNYNIKPYAKEYLLEIIKTIGPIVFIVLVMHFSFLKLPREILFRFLLGTLMVVVGLNMFLKGIKIGLIPVGEMIGSELPKKGSVALMLAIGFVLGLSVTIAEPDVRVLAAQVDFVSNGGIDKNILILAIGIGIGLFLLISILRIIKNIPLIYFLFAGYITILVLSFFTPQKFVPISFDSGGVTTGPLTVPFIMAFGIGISSVLGGRSNLSDSFGLIGIASIGPVITVMILGVIYG